MSLYALCLDPACGDCLPLNHMLREVPAQAFTEASFRQGMRQPTPMWLSGRAAATLLALGVPPLLILALYILPRQL